MGRVRPAKRGRKTKRKPWDSPPKTKEFGGKRYKRLLSALTKPAAERVAQNARENGKLARVSTQTFELVRSRGTTTSTKYVVYVK